LFSKAEEVEKKFLKGHSCAVGSLAGDHRRYSPSQGSEGKEMEIRKVHLIIAGFPARDHRRYSPSYRNLEKTPSAPGREG